MIDNIQYKIIIGLFSQNMFIKSKKQRTTGPAEKCWEVQDLITPVISSSTIDWKDNNENYQGKCLVSEGWKYNSELPEGRSETQN